MQSVQHPFMVTVDVKWTPGGGAAAAALLQLMGILVNK